MSEFRQNPTTSNWVITAPGRDLRPHDGSGAAAPHSTCSTIWRPWSGAFSLACAGLSTIPRTTWSSIARRSARRGCEYFSWHVQIVPRIATPAGFELGTGVFGEPVVSEGDSGHPSIGSRSRVISGSRQHAFRELQAQE